VSLSNVENALRSSQSLLDVAFSSSPPDLPLAALAIETGCEVDPVSPSTNGALHKSAQKGYAEACTFLISHGADPNRPGRQNFTPTILACRSCKVEAVKALVEGGGRWRDEGGKDGLDIARKQGERGEGVVKYLESL